MEDNDTIKLLKECDAGSKMAVSAIDDVLDKAENDGLIDILEKSKQHHTELGNELHSLLNEHSRDDKSPHPIAKSMAHMKTNMKMSMNESDETIADLITDGCNMGVKSLHKYLNQYKNADEKSKGICKKLIDIELDLSADIASFL